MHSYQPCSVCFNSNLFAKNVQFVWESVNAQSNATHQTKWTLVHLKTYGSVWLNQTMLQLNCIYELQADRDRTNTRKYTIVQWILSTYTLNHPAG